MSVGKNFAQDLKLYKRLDLEQNIENKSCFYTWVYSKVALEPSPNPQTSQIGQKSK